MSIYIFTFMLATLFSLILSPVVIKIATKIGAVDIPNNRKIHAKPIPRLGGLAIYMSTILTVLINFKHLNNNVRGLLLGSLIIIVCGVLDDIYELHYKTKLLFQLFAALILIFNGVIVEKISLFSFSGSSFLNLSILSYPITILWVIGIINAINLIDGLDGLACGLTAISLFFLSLIFIGNGTIPMAILAITILGACIGFLPYNFNPAKVFMGDTGSMFLGYMLAGISIQGTVKNYTAVIVIVPLLIIGLPIYDTLFTIFRRFLSGKPIMAPDKEHFHHRLLSLGLSQRKVALIGYTINLILGFLALFSLMVKRITTAILILIFLICIFLFLLENIVYKRKILDIQSTTRNKKEKTTSLK